MASRDQEVVLKVKQEPTWQEEYRSNQEGFRGASKEDDERSSRSPDSQGTENIEMGDLDNETATWCEEESGNLCDPLCHMTSDVLHDGSPDSSDDGDGVGYDSKRGPIPRGGSKGSRWTKALRRTPRDKTKPSGRRPSYQDLDDVQLLSDTPQSPEKRTETGSPVMKKRKKSQRLILSDEQEAGLVQWLKDNPELYNKMSKKYKDPELKSCLWDEKSIDLGLESVELLRIWYKSMRTRFGKLRKISLRDKSREFTARDRWILENFAFMSPHISASRNMHSRSSAPRPAPQPQSCSEEEWNEDDLYTVPTFPGSTTVPSTTPSISATPSVTVSALPQDFMKIDTSLPAMAPDADLVRQASQTIPHAGLHLPGGSAILSTPNDSMAKGYGTFLSTVVTSLHPSLLMKFYHESWGMVMKYHAESEQLKCKEQQTQSVPTVRPVHMSSQMSASNPQSQYVILNPQGSSQGQLSNHHPANTNAH